MIAIEAGVGLRAPDEKNQVTMVTTWIGVFIWQQSLGRLTQINAFLAPLK